MSQSSQTNKAYLLIALNLNFAPVEKVLEGTNLDMECLDWLESINVEDAVTIIHNLNRYSYTPIWSAIFGAHLGMTSHGPVGHATLSAPTVGIALHTFVEWYRIRSETYTGLVVERNAHFEILVSDTTGDPVFQEYFFEAFSRALEVLITVIIGKKAESSCHIYFKNGAENRRVLLEGEYDATLHFNQSDNKLLIPKSLWMLPSPLRDDDSFELNIRKCQQLLESNQHHRRIDVVVKGLLARHFENVLLASVEPSLPPTQQEICEHLHLTERTLIRKLKQVGTSYKQVLAEERKRYAERMLKDAKYTVFHVAEKLGYRESSNFCRAFKRWFGHSPTEYRRRL